MSVLIDEFLKVLDLKPIIDKANEIGQRKYIINLVGVRIKKDEIYLSFSSEEGYTSFDVIYENQGQSEIFVYNEEEELEDYIVSPLTKGLILESGLNLLRMDDILPKTKLIQEEIFNKKVDYSDYVINVKADYKNNKLYSKSTSIRGKMGDIFKSLDIKDNKIIMGPEKAEILNLTFKLLDNGDQLFYNKYFGFYFYDLECIVYKKPRKTLDRKQNMEVELKMLVGDTYENILIFESKDVQVFVDYNQNVYKIEGSVSRMRDYRFLLKETLPEIYDQLNEEFWEKLELLENL